MITLSQNHTIEVIDYGAETVGGYAAFEVEAFDPAPDGTLPVLRLSYACHPDSIRPEGDFPREEGAYYLHVDNPVLPANPGRHELYTIPRTGTFVAPLVQGQLRYLRVALETSGAAVTLSSIRIANPGVHADTPPCGSFTCADKGLEAVWRLGVRSCQMASLTNPDAWRVVEGALLPRRLERGGADGWCRYVPDFEGTLELDVEFRRNPHFDGPAFFEVFTGWREGAEPAVCQTVRQQGPDGEIRTARIPLKPGRFGFRLEKEQWPVIHEVRVMDNEGNARWGDDFGASVPSGAAPNWVYPSAPPYLADGGKRDRLVWSGDLWWSQRTMYYAFGPDDPHMKGALRILAFNQTPEGFIHAAPYATNAAPPRSGDSGLFASDEFSAWFVPVLWEHYLFTGDEALARELWPAADRDLAYLATRMGPDGLHEPRLETSKHAYKMDCGDLSKRAYQNLVFWMAWRDGARLARALGLAARAAALEALARDHAAAIRRFFKDPATGDWNTVLGQPGADPLSCAMLLASGFLADAEAAALVRSRPNGDYGVGKFRALAIRGMFRHGLVEEALRLIDEGGWNALADPAWPGAHCTTECLYRYSVGWWDESHPDTSISDIYPAFVLGVEPVEPGFKTFRVAPKPPPGLAWARGAIHTPRGDIEVAWEKTGEGLALSLSVPSGLAPIVADPSRKTTVAVHVSF
ncbi:MAG: hypothetical protein IJP66_01170 [Kiritimatiellae bacterium]|nr:hypothetical protein [Kiritimatiellia bacterium]